MLNELLVTLDNPNSPMSEQYRRVTTNIEYANVDRKVKVVNITSVLANESKSTTACNLAIMFANKMNRVLIIDADLRKPSVHKYLNMKTGKGLTDLLKDYSNKDNQLNQVNLDEYIKSFEHRKVRNHLDVLIAGRKIYNTAEFLGSKTMKQLVDDISEHYDMIIIDSTPSGFIVDGIVTSATSHGTVFVIEHGRNKIEAAKETIDNLKRAGANIIGGVITKAPMKNDYFSRYFNQYSYYSNDEDGAVNE